jgi:hypothetical protein
MLERAAIAAPTRGPTILGALVIAGLALLPLMRLAGPGPQAVPCAVHSVHPPHATTIRTRSPGLNPRYMTRTLCTHDDAGRRICAW